MPEDPNVTPQMPENPAEPKNEELRPEDLDEVSGGKNEIGRGPN